MKTFKSTRRNTQASYSLSKIANIAVNCTRRRPSFASFQFTQRKKKTEMGGTQAWKRIPRIKFPQRHPTKSSGSRVFYLSLISPYCFSFFICLMWSVKKCCGSSYTHHYTIHWIVGPINRVIVIVFAIISISRDPLLHVFLRSWSIEYAIFVNL